MKIDSNSYAVASKVVKTFSMTATRIRGQKVATNDRWLQVFDAKALPANGTVPMKSYAIFGQAPFDFDLRGESALSFATGMVVAVSTTEGTLTISVETVDLFVTGQSETDDSAWSVAGDYTTGVETLQVWADSAGPKRLYRLEIFDGNGDIAYIQLHAGDTPATNKIVSVFPINVNVWNDLWLGGLNPLCQVDGVLFDGCTVALSSTPLTYTAIGSNDYFIKASYV